MVVVQFIKKLVYRIYWIFNSFEKPMEGFFPLLIKFVAQDLMPNRMKGFHQNKQQKSLSQHSIIWALVK